MKSYIPSVKRSVAILIILATAALFACSEIASPVHATTASGPIEYLYAADYNHDQIQIYNASSNLSKTASIQIEKPLVLVASHDGTRVYAASSGILNSRLYVINTSTNKISAKYLLPDSGAGSIAISPDDRYVYVATSTQLVVLDTTSDRTREYPIGTDHYISMTTAMDQDTYMVYLSATGTGKLLSYNEKDHSVNTYTLNSEVGHIAALDTTHILGTDKLGEINTWRYNDLYNINAWTYTPHPIGGSSWVYDPYIALSHDKKTAYLMDTENNIVYKINLSDYTYKSLKPLSAWQSPTNAVFSSDDSRVFICDDTGVTGIYVGDDKEYNYYYGFKASDVAVSQVSGAEPVASTPTVQSPSPETTAMPATGQPDVTSTPIATNNTTTPTQKIASTPAPSMGLTIAVVLLFALCVAGLNWINTKGRR
ncbi:MAG TPA: hypothetical protein VK436_00355 [Methanocella sp.]|nr:hypothetical protein [Methanocella sp.]